MNKPDHLKSVLHQFEREWDAAQQADNRLRAFDLYKKIRNANWLLQIKALPEQERIAVLQDAFVTDPPNYIRTNNGPGGSRPIMAFCIGAICLDKQEDIEDFFTTALRHRVDGRWAYAAVKPLGPIRTIDLVFQTYQDPDDLTDFLYDFAPTLLPAVAPEDRDAVRQYYKKRRMESREQNRPFSKPEEAIEYAQRLDAVLEYYLDLPDLAEQFRS